LTKRPGFESFKKLSGNVLQTEHGALSALQTSTLQVSFRSSESPQGDAGICVRQAGVAKRLSFTG